MLPDYIEDLCEKWALVGSRVTCVPPPMDTDQDILVLASIKGYDELEQELRANRWKEDGDYGAMTEFVSYKKQENGDLLNVILTDDPEWFDTFLAATAECAENNYLLKSERIKCFDKHFGRDEKKAATKKFDAQSYLQKYVQEMQAASAQAVAQVQAHAGLSQGIQGSYQNGMAAQQAIGASSFGINTNLFAQFYNSPSSAVGESNW